MYKTAIAKTAHISVRTDAELKSDVDNILKKLGLSQTEAINIFYAQIKLNNGLPFEIKIPNKETKKAIEDL